MVHIISPISGIRGHNRGRGTTKLDDLPVDFYALRVVCVYFLAAFSDKFILMSFGLWDYFGSDFFILSTVYTIKRRKNEKKNTCDVFLFPHPNTLNVVIYIILYNVNYPHTRVGYTPTLILNLNKNTLGIINIIIIKL